MEQSPLEQPYSQLALFPSHGKENKVLFEAANRRGKAVYLVLSNWGVNALCFDLPFRKIKQRTL